MQEAYSLLKHGHTRTMFIEWDSLIQSHDNCPILRLILTRNQRYGN